MADDLAALQQPDAAASAAMAAGLGQVSPAPALSAAATAEPKGALNHFAQRYCKRPVTKDDIVYTSAKYGKVFQVTVTLNCMEGQQFVGETAVTLKEAEKNAAYQALIHFEPLNDALPALPSKNKKRKATPSAAPGGAMALPMDGGFGAEEPALKALKAMSGGATMGGLSVGGSDNPALTSKVVLNTVCMKLLKRPMQKGEICYETHQTPIGFQSTVRLPCLPGEWGELAWAGEVAQQQKQAEQNAAKEALEAVNQNAENIKSLLPGQPPKMGGGKGWMDGKGQWGGGKGKGKGKWGDFWGKGGMMGGGMGMEMDPSMGMLGGFGGELEASAMPGGQRTAPKEPLPRSRTTEVAITGEIVEWKGKYGWLRPHAEVQHPMAKKRGGKIFMSSKDVVGTVDLTVGTMVQFHIYEDPTGLGAEEVTAF